MRTRKYVGFAILAGIMLVSLYFFALAMRPLVAILATPVRIFS